MGYRKTTGSIGLSKVGNLCDDLNATPQSMFKTQNVQGREEKMTRIKILGLVVLAVVLLSNMAPAQPPDTLWTRTYGGSANDMGYTVEVTADGSYIIAGYTSYGAEGSDIYLIKTDSLGDMCWTKIYGGSYIDKAYSMVETSDGGYIIAGRTRPYVENNGNVYLIKTDGNGDSVWTKTYGGEGDEYGWSVVQTDDGGYIIAGETGSFGAGDVDVYIIRTDTNGDTLWTKTYGGSDNDGGRSVAQTSDGGYIIAGYTESFGAGDRDVYLIRLGPETGVEENSNLTLESPNLRLGQNPISTTTTISYQIPVRSEVSLSVYDISGSEIKRLVANVQERGDYHLQLNLTGYAQGVYFINLTAGKLRSVKKVIVLQ